MVPVMAPHAVIADRMTVGQLAGYVIEMAERKGMKAGHNPYSGRTPDGFPNLVITGSRGAIFAHLLDESGDLTPRQKLWAVFLMEAGATWWLWRPLSLQHGVINRELEAIR